MGEAVSSKFSEYTLYSTTAPWKLYVKPFRLAPRIYYVGNEWVGAFLIDTEEGLILIDTVVFETTYLTLENIRSLGFDPMNLKHIFLSHCHMDHTAGAEPLRQLTGATVWMSEIDTKLLENPVIKNMGNMGNVRFVTPEYRVDRFYDDSKPMQFGSVTIQTILTPGHTPGTTSFVITMPGDDGKPVVAAMHGGVGPLTMTNATYDQLGAPRSLRRTFIEDCDKLKALHVDIAIPSHPAHGGLFARLGEDKMDYHSFVDTTLWGSFLDSRKGFVEELERKEAANQ